MEIIKQHAVDFFSRFYKRKKNNPSDFIDSALHTLKVYKKPIYKVEFLSEVIALIKKDYDNHLKFCEAHKTSTCRFSKYYEHVLFFLLEELQQQEAKLSSYSFKSLERKMMDEKIQTILNEMDSIGLSNEVKFDIFKAEIEDLKKYYFLTKKNWMQLFIGKMAEMVDKSIVNKSIYKSVYQKINEIYPSVIKVQ